LQDFQNYPKKKKINWIAKEYFSTPSEAIALLKNYWNTDEKYKNCMMNS
jgi:hydroxymethylglutaryl-CoA reductase